MVSGDYQMKKSLAPFALCFGLGAASVLLSSSLVRAETHNLHGRSFTQEDKAAFLDAKLAALKAGLKLTPAQEKNWPAVESAIRAYDKAKQDQTDIWEKAAHDEHQHDDLIDHMHRKAQFLSAYAVETNKLADAVKPLYESLDEAQKHRLGVLLHLSKQMHGRQGWSSRGEDAPDGPKPESGHDGK
jgi:hypothetical protein